MPVSSFWRFAATGAVATLAHVAVATALVEALDLHPAIANGVAFIVANLLSYFVNTLWSFDTRLTLSNWRRFLLVSTGAWSLTIALAWGMEQAGSHYLAGIAVIVLLVPAATYVAHRRFTYRHPA